MSLSRRLFHPLPILCVAMLGMAGAVIAQIEGGERGVPPIDSSSSYEVSGVAVDIAARTADEARLGGWREAQRRAWKMLWGRVNGQPPASSPGLPDSTLDSIVTGIVVEDEQIGPTRYIARLGVLFDRARAGQLLGVEGQMMRSPPMLVVPVQWSGGTPQTFEARTEWQKAWARFRTGGSPVDYVRPAGTGSDPLLLNDAQSRRRGRTWWRMLLDQYGAADIVTPEVRLERQWPGGPVFGHFTAYHGPDREFIEQFTLRAANAEALPRMMDEGVRRVDEAYTRALRDGRLQPDPSLVIEDPETDVEEEVTTGSETVVAESSTPVTGAAVNVQVDTPDAASLGLAESALRSVPGVRFANMTSLALGGVSVIRVVYQGEPVGLQIALAARGWRVTDAGGGLRIQRAARPAAPPPPPAAPPADATTNSQGAP